MPYQPMTPERNLASGEVPESTSAPRRHSPPQEHPSGFAIIGSKIGPAAPARSILARPRLVDWFGQHAHARLVLVSAEAGYGKTTLLAEFANHTRDRVVWYRLERSDGDWITFLSYLVAALRDIWPSFGRPTEALLRNVAAMGSSREVVLAQFLADLSSADAGRVAVILDDYHLVEASPDVRMIVSRMLERAPEGMYFILAGRGAPNLALGRLTGQGRVNGLTIDDLRFTLAEIEQLFATTYGQPLDGEACRIIAERTEGWAAGLQLVAASIAVSQPDEIAAFIRALSGAAGPIYDFLAEEVLTRLSSDTQRVLMHASLVDRVRTEYVAAALSAGGTPFEPSVIEASLDRAEALGLLGVRSKASNIRRLQALFREFLQVHLEREVSVESIRAMHLAIARASEQDDWLMAAQHYAKGGDHANAMRVLGSAAGEALGTGAWGAAVEIVELMPETAPPPAVKVIQARALISDEHPDRALEVLSSIDRNHITPEERGLVGLTWAAIHHMNGEREPYTWRLMPSQTTRTVPALLRDIAVSWRLIVEPVGVDASRTPCHALRALAARQRNVNIQYFAGVTLHNAAFAELSRRQLRSMLATCPAKQSHHSSGAEDEDGSQRRPIDRSSRTCRAWRPRGRTAVGQRVRYRPGATADAIAEAAYMHAVCGRGKQSEELFSPDMIGAIAVVAGPRGKALGCYAKFAIMSAKETQRSQEALRTLKDSTPTLRLQSRQAVLSQRLLS